MDHELEMQFGSVIWIGVDGEEEGKRFSKKKKKEEEGEDKEEIEIRIV